MTHSNEEIAEFRIRYVDLGLRGDRYAYFAEVLGLAGCLTESHGATRGEALSVARREIRGAIADYLDAVPQMEVSVRSGGEQRGVKFTREQGDKRVLVVDAARHGSGVSGKKTMPALDIGFARDGSTVLHGGFIEFTRIPISELRERLHATQRHKATT